MFKVVNASETETREFNTYADAYRFVMKEGDHSRLWGIYAIRPDLVEVCRAERNAFHKAV